MNRYASIVVAVVVSLGVLSACVRSQAPAQAPGRVGTGGTTVSSAKADWQADWERTLAEAKKEGKLVLLTGVGPAVRDSLSKAFTEATGVQIEFITGAGQQQIAKLAAERRAGLFTADAAIAGVNTPINGFKPAGFIVPLEPLLVLPEVKDPQFWLEKRLNFIDKEGTTLTFTSMVGSNALVVNTEGVGAGDIKGYRDLLDPKWKGKVTLADPTVPGVGLRWFQVVSQKLMDTGYMRQFATPDLSVVRDRRQHAEWVARGKYPIGVAVEPSSLAEFEKAGVPLKRIIPVEGAWVAAGWGVVSVIDRAPHPNAAKSFLNWLLTREGQTVFSTSAGWASRRTDVPRDQFRPDEIPEPGKMYVGDDLDIILSELEARKAAAEIFGLLLK